MDLMKKDESCCFSFVLKLRNYSHFLSPLSRHLPCTVVRNSGKYVSEVQDSGFVPMQGIQGNSVLFHIVKKQEADPEEVSWGFGLSLTTESSCESTVGQTPPTWISLQDRKYQQRVHVPNVTSLRIENLTPEQWAV